MEIKNKIIEYLTFNCRNFFMTYPEDKIINLSGFFYEIQESLIEDIVYWYKKYQTILTEQNYFSYLQMSPNWEAVFYYRLSRQVFLADPNNEFLPYLASLMKYKTGAELYYSTNIGSRFMLMHGSGVVIGPNCTIGDECLIYQGVTVGQQHNDSPHENAVIGNKVKLFAGAKILGKVSIGDHVIVGANAVVTKNLPPNGVYIGAPARKIRAVKQSYALPNL